MSQIRNKKSWSFLAQGDVVDVIAPGFRCSEEEVAGAAKFIESLGLVPRIPRGIFKGKTLFSNSDDFRTKHLIESLTSSDSAAVWCVRGGYGSLRLLPALKKAKKPSRVKLFMGYSDITTLHLFLNQFWGWSTLHSPVLDRFGGGRAIPLEIREAKQFLFGKKREQVLKGLKPLNASAKKSGSVKASVVGGNVAVLQSSLATPFQMDAAGKILFLEDIGERPHRMDRMLVQLEQTGLLKSVKAIVFGDMVLGNEVERKQLWNEVITGFAVRQKFPVFKGLKVGHGSVQQILPFNTSAVLKCGKSGVLSVDIGGVE